MIQEIADALYARGELGEVDLHSKAGAERAVKVVLAEIAHVLRTFGRAELRGFGTFTVQQCPARPGHNPRTGEPIMIPAQRRVAFRAGQALRDAVQR